MHFCLCRSIWANFREIRNEDGHLRKTIAVVAPWNIVWSCENWHVHYLQYSKNVLSVRFHSSVWLIYYIRLFLKEAEVLWWRINIYKHQWWVWPKDKHIRLSSDRKWKRGQFSNVFFGAQPPDVFGTMPFGVRHFKSISSAKG